MEVTFLSIFISVSLSFLLQIDSIRDILQNRFLVAIGQVDSFLSITITASISDNSVSHISFIASKALHLHINLSFFSLSKLRLTIFSLRDFFFEYIEMYLSSKMALVLF